MTDREDIEMLAGEYVLGTLDDAERSQIAARRQREPALDDAIVAWEMRLSPLLDHVEGVAPRDLLADIQKRIDGAAAVRGAPGGGQPAAAGEVIQLRNRVKRWRVAAIGASAIAASLLGLIVLREAVAPAQNQQFVAVFNRGDEAPSFLLTIDLKSRALSIRPVGAKPQQGRTYQLWIASDQLGPAPRSLGLLDEPEQPTRKVLLDYEPALLRNATFGISLEPEGGSPTGRPTGPALHGKLVPAVP